MADVELRSTGARAASGGALGVWTRRLRLWARAGSWRGIGRAQVFSFFIGEAVLVVALLSPLDRAWRNAAVGAYGAARPADRGSRRRCFFWAVPGSRSPGRFRRASDAFLCAPGNGGRSQDRERAHPACPRRLVAWAGAVGLARPRSIRCGPGSGWLHAFEHASFFVTALLFWRALDTPAARPSRPLGAAFFTLVHSGLLGALITLSPRPLYGWYGAPNSGD